MARLDDATAQRELVITRVFDAPRELVWNAWTRCEHFTRWWGPKGFTAPFCAIDLRVGGRYLYCMRSPDGRDMWSTGVYREIVPVERLVATQSLADEHGNVVPPPHHAAGDGVPLETLVTVTLEDLGGTTRLTFTHAGLPAGPMRESAGAGWNQAFDKLAASLEGAA